KRIEEAGTRGDDAWLYDLLAELTQKARGTVTAQTRLAADLGIDSLLVAELAVALEKAGVAPPDEGSLAVLQTAGDLARALARPRAAEPSAEVARDDGKLEEEVPVPDAVAAAGRAGRVAQGIGAHRRADAGDRLPPAHLPGRDALARRNPAGIQAGHRLPRVCRRYRHPARVPRGDPRSDAEGLLPSRPTQAQEADGSHRSAAARFLAARGDARHVALGGPPRGH